MLTLEIGKEYLVKFDGECGPTGSFRSTLKQFITTSGIAVAKEEVEDAGDFSPLVFENGVLLVYPADCAFEEIASPEAIHACVK